MVVRTKTKLAKAAVASFGAALTSLNVAPQLDAAIIDLSGNFNPSYLTSSTSASVDFIFGSTADFFQVNDSSGKTMTAYTSQLLGFNVKNSDDLISAGQVFNQTVFFSYDDDYDLILGFLTADNRVGWLKVDLGGDTNLVYLGAAYNDAGGRILAGTLSVPEPSTAALAGLAALALGASGVRRMRKGPSKSRKQQESFDTPVLK